MIINNNINIIKTNRYKGNSIVMKRNILFNHDFLRLYDSDENKGEKLSSRT